VWSGSALIPPILLPTISNCLPRAVWSLVPNHVVAGSWEALQFRHLYFRRDRLSFLYKNEGAGHRGFWVGLEDSGGIGDSGCGVANPHGP